MKRVISFILALTLILSMGITAFAAEEKPVPESNMVEQIQGDGYDGSITISNATVGEVYTIYKIFGAEIKEKDDGTLEGITYTVDPESAAFKAVFGDGETAESAYFVYIPSNKTVTKVEGVNDTQLTKELEKIVNDNPNSFPHVSAIATDGSLAFNNLAYGYYLIQSTLGATATINSNTPTVTVIDKNQIPGGFDKYFEDEKGNRIYNESANIGDVITYNISFTATQYSGDQLIKYYQVFDEKGTGIWAEFNSFQVYVDGKLLKNGHYLNAGGNNTDNWGPLDEEEGGYFTVDQTPNDSADDAKILNDNLDIANWYLVHTGYETYSILIPWMTDHYIDEDNGNALKFREGAVSKYTKPVEVKIVYTAAVEPSANVGGNSDNLFNKATLTWRTEHDTHSIPSKEVHTQTYGIGIVKEDATTHKNLPGATFKIWKAYNIDTKAYSEPVYVIPTGIDGVYMLDSMGTDADEVSGDFMDTAREYFVNLRAPNGDVLDGNPATKDVVDVVPNEALDALGDNLTNEVVTQVNGKVVILGLELGTYYLEESDPPTGYNGLSEPVVLTITENSSSAFPIYAERNGDVIDTHQATGTQLKYNYYVTYETVGNSTGTVLPSTGGEGRTMLITMGSMIAIGFAILLITQKKMSVYTD